MSAGAAPLPPLLVLTGPTGSGKSDLALELSDYLVATLPVEIVSVDSVQVYRGMDIGSAKPGAEARARVPHHLIDITTPDQPFTAGEYSRQARAKLREIAGRGKLPIVTGGTGLYLRALTEGLFAGPARQVGLRERLTRSRERHGETWMRMSLREIDQLFLRGR